MAMTAERLDALRLIERADVYKAGRLAAHLTRSRDGVRFGYAPQWLAEAGLPVASTLPLTSEALIRPGGAVPAYFEGLLPEGRRMGALRRAMKTSADDELTLLLGVGADAIGDVQVVPEGISPAAVPPRLEVDEFAEVSFETLLDEVGIHADRVALPGVQEKVSAAVLNLPVARHGTRFILKLNPPEFPQVVANEALFLRCAALAGLSTVTAEVVTDRDGGQGLLVQRFDRPASGGKPAARGSSPAMLAVEDACQATGRPPADKYRVDSAEAFRALIHLCGDPEPAACDFLGQLVFAYLSGNGDAHGKNFSVLRGPDGQWRPSPAYDLPSTYPYGDTTLAMPLTGRVSGDYTGADFVELGVRLGLATSQARSVVLHQAQRVDAWFPLVADLPFDDRRLHKLTRFIRNRRDLLTRRTAG
jgi:serine/threonine-protein kinase HipA